MCLKCDIPDRLEEVEEEKHSLTDGEYLKKMNILKKLYDSVKCECPETLINQRFLEMWSTKQFDLVGQYRNITFIEDPIKGGYFVVIDNYPEKVIWKYFKDMKEGVQEFADKILQEYPSTTVKLTAIDGDGDEDRVEILYT